MRLPLIVTSLLSLIVLSSSSLGAVAQTPNHKLKNGVSTNWSGYAAETNLSKPLSGSVSDVKGQWTVPSVACDVSTGHTYSSAWVGIDGYSNGTVEQVGTEQDCNFGSPVNYAWYEMYPKYPVRITMSARPGDVMSAEVHYNGNNKFVLTINNLTLNQAFSTTQKASAKRQSAEWVVEAPSSTGGVLPLANFATAYFTNASATINGVAGPISSGAWTYDPITMADASGTTKATPSALDTTGQAFSVTWNHQ
jgi:hypothetical protein